MENEGRSLLLSPPVTPAEGRAAPEPGESPLPCLSPIPLPPTSPFLPPEMEMSRFPPPEMSPFMPPLESLRLESPLLESPASGRSFPSLSSSSSSSSRKRGTQWRQLQSELAAHREAVKEGVFAGMRAGELEGVDALVSVLRSLSEERKETLGRMERWMESGAASDPSTVRRVRNNLSSRLSLSRERGCARASILLEALKDLAGGGGTDVERVLSAVRSAEERIIRRLERVEEALEEGEARPSRRRRQATLDEWSAPATPATLQEGDIVPTTPPS